VDVDGVIVDPEAEDRQLHPVRERHGAGLAVDPERVIEEPEEI
jgi:hypothetical protein